MYLRKLSLAAALLLLVSAQCFAAGSIAGNVTDTEDNRGQYESEIFACKTGTSSNTAYDRLDTAGYYNLTDLSAGTYSLGLNDNFHFMPRLRSFVPVTDGKVNPGSFKMKSTYQLHGGYMTTGSPQYADIRQSFIATGDIAKITVWAEPSDQQITVTIHLASSGAQIGPTKKTNIDDRGTVKYLHGQVPTTPGTSYYVKLTRGGGKLLYVMIDDDNPYSGGCAYYDGVAQSSIDIGMVIESDDAGLSTMYQRSINDSGQSGTEIGQTFKAIGSNVAIVTIFATSASPDGTDVAFSILSGGYGGAQVGPTKTVRVRNYQPMGQWVAITWEPGEVPVTSGQTYYLKMASTGFYEFTCTSNPYPDGCMYLNGVARTGDDIMATIMGEITANSSLGTLSGTVTNSSGSPLSGATILTIPFNYTTTSGTSGTYSLNATPELYYVKCTKPYYQQGTTNLTLTPGGTTTQNFSLTYTGSLLQNATFEYGFSSGVANSWASYVVSGSPSFLKEMYFIHGGTASQRWWTSWTAHDAGIYQQVAATSGTSYTLTAWTWRRDTTGGGKEASKIGIDPYGGTDPTSANVVWSTTSTAMDTWVQQSVVATAQSGTITIFIRGTATATGEAMITCVDDCILVTNSSTGTISGTVKDPGGVGIVGATVSTNVGGYSTTSGTGGAYTLSNVVPATYNVTASKTYYTPQTVNNVVVNAGQTTTCNFTLTPTTGAISGTVKDTSGTGIVGATVATNTGGYTTTSGTGGAYTLSNVAPATYNVTASKTGYNPQTVNGVVVTAGQTTTCNFTLTQILVAEDFTTMPTWSSSFDATWGSAATWSIVAGGQSGNFLQAARSSQGSSVKALVYTVPTSASITISVYMKCPSYTANEYWMESGYRFGSRTAQDFDANPGSWTLIKKFSKSGTNGNGNVWTNYSVAASTGTNTQITIGYKLGSQSGAGPTVGWDTFRIIR